MKERPILFSAPMVRALLAGTKTQTRRLINPQPYMAPTLTSIADVKGGFFDNDGYAVKCPYGQPGERLWVREAWHPDPEDDGTWAYTQWTGCKGSPLSDIPKKFQKPEHCIHRATWAGVDLIWRPSIHMPRWASRILLEIVSVRVERLRDINEADAIAEGVEPNWCGELSKGPNGFGGEGWVPDCGWINYLSGPDGEEAYTAAESYRTLWESINGAGSWDANPWVWVVEFRRVMP